MGVGEADISVDCTAGRRRLPGSALAEEDDPVSGHLEPSLSGSSFISVRTSHLGAAIGIMTKGYNGLQPPERPVEFRGKDEDLQFAAITI